MTEALGTLVILTALILLALVMVTLILLSPALVDAVRRLRRKP